jgi:hypothetical protein
VVCCGFELQCVPTFTSASNQLIITDLPFISNKAAVGWGGSVAFRGIKTAAGINAESYKIQVTPDSRNIIFYGSVEGATGPHIVEAVDITSASTFIASGCFMYLTDG